MVSEGNTIWHVRVYVSRVWYHRGGTNNAANKHTDLVLLETHGNRMYAQIPRKNEESYMDSLIKAKVMASESSWCFPETVSLGQWKVTQ